MKHYVIMYGDYGYEGDCVLGVTSSDILPHL